MNKLILATALSFLSATCIASTPPTIQIEFTTNSEIIKSSISLFEGIPSKFTALETVSFLTPDENNEPRRDSYQSGISVEIEKSDSEQDVYAVSYEYKIEPEFKTIEDTNLKEIENQHISKGTMTVKVPKGSKSCTSIDNINQQMCISVL